MVDSFAVETSISATRRDKLQNEFFKIAQTFWIAYKHIYIFLLNNCNKGKKEFFRNVMFKVKTGYIAGRSYDARAVS